MEIVRNELQFYSKFANPLIFQLPDAKDRVLAAGWLKKIRDENVGSEKLRTDYIKLLLFALQRQKLVGIFAEDPERYDVLEDFPSEFDLNTMAKNLIRKEQFERVDRIRRQLRGQIGDSPPYLTDCSSDFREYVAAQDIPGFGVHCYYAISKDPIDTWIKADRGIFPKMAKSAVDTSSSTPPGFAGKSSDPSCVCPPAPGEPDSSCKARVHKDEPKKRKKKRSKNLGKSPPAHPLGHTAPPDEREPPSWSSNLMEIKDASGAAGEMEPATSTGAIPKRKGEKRFKDPVKFDESDVYGDDLKDMEAAMKDYQRGSVKAGVKAGRPKKQVRQKRKGEEDVAEDVVEEEEDVPLEEDQAPLEDNFDDIEQSQYQEEVDKDSRLLEYFKGKLAQSGIKQRLAGKSRLVKGACPAKSGIPLTTPRPSALPKRQKSVEKLYKDDDLPETDKKRDQKHQPSGLKDPEVYKLFEEASALETQEDEEEDEKQLEEIIDTDAQPAATEGTYGDFEYQQLLEKQKQQEQNLYDEPPAPIQKGSTQANAIFSEAMDIFQGESPSELPDDWFERVQNDADEFLPWDIPQHSTIPQDYGGHGLPELVSVQPNISPYKPYRPEREPRQAILSEPVYSEPVIQSPRADPLTTTPPGESPMQVGSGSPDLVNLLGYTTPEHLKIRTVERQPTPQVMIPPPIAQLPRSRSPPSEVASRSPPDLRMPAMKDDAFFFDMSIEQPPVYWSPQESPDSPDMLTVQGPPPRHDRDIFDVPPQNILEAQTVDEADMAFILDGSYADDIFGEDMPYLEEGIEPHDLDDGYFDLNDDYVATSKRWERNEEPSWKEKVMTDVGFCLADTIRATEQRTDTRYVSPKPRKLSAPRTEISEQERRYIDYLFPEDEDMNKLMKRVSGMVSDVEQDFPDPYHLLPASPELPDVEGPDFDQETFPVLDFYSSPEPSPTAQPPQAQMAGPSTSGIPKPGQSGIKPPGARGIPIPKGAIPRRTSGIPAPGGGAPRTSGIPTPGVAGPRRSGIPAPGGGAPRTSGIPTTGVAGPRRSGIPAPGGGAPRTSGIPKPGVAGPRRSGIPAPGGGGAPRTSGIPTPGVAGPRRSDLPRPGGAGQRPPADGVPRPADAGPKLERPKPSQPISRQPIYAKQPLYFPTTQMISGNWPQMSLGFHRDMRDYQVDENVLDIERQRMTSKQVLVGATAGRRHDTRRKFRPRETIQEHPDEPSLTPRKYGPYPDTRAALAEPVEPDVPPTFEEMLASYIPPIYTSPGEGILEATPPFIDVGEDPEIKKELIYDETKERVPLDMKHMRRILERRHRMNDALCAEIEELLNRRYSPESGGEEVLPRRPAPIHPGPTLDQDAPPFAEPYIETPRKREIPRDRRRRRTRVPPGMRIRRIDFDERDPDEVSETEKFIEDKLTQHEFTLTPPEPTSPLQYGIIDERIPPDVRLPVPISAPTIIEGWKTPPRLSRRPKPPPVFQAKLPPVDPNQWFFQTEEEPEFATSPTELLEYDPGHYTGYDIRTPELVQGGGQMGGLFFDELDEISPLPELGPSPEQTFITPVRPTRTMPVYKPLPSPRRMRTPPQIRVSPATPSDVCETPLGSFSEHLVTPSPDAHMKTPVTSAGRIFRAAGVEHSPLTYSPLADPADMEEMIQRVSEAQGRRGIRIMKEDAALPYQQRPPPQHTRTPSGLRKQLQKRWIEQEKLYRDPTPRPTRPRKRPTMAVIREDRTPPPPPPLSPPPSARDPCAPRAPCSQRVSGPPPGPPPDPHGLPPLLTFAGPQITPRGQRPPQGPMPRKSRVLQGKRFLTRKKLDFETPPQDDMWGYDQYIQEVMSRQNLPPLSPQGQVPLADLPATSTCEPLPPSRPHIPQYDLPLPQVGEGYSLDQSPMPDIGASPDLATPDGRYPPLIQITSPSPRTPDFGPSHGITMATCGSSQRYTPDFFVDDTLDSTATPWPSHGITMATLGSSHEYMPDSFLETSPDSPLSPPFTGSPGAGFRTPERPIRAGEIFSSAGVQQSPLRMPTPSPTMQEMVGRVREAEGRGGIRSIREQRQGRRASPEQAPLKKYLEGRWSRIIEEDDDVPKQRITRRRPGPPSMPTVREQTPPIDRYGLPAVERASHPARIDPYYSPPPQPQPPRSCRDVLPDEPGMQRAIDSLREGRAMDLEAIQVAASPIQQIPQSPCSPATLPGYKTPEHLRLRQQSPLAPRAMRARRVRSPQQRYQSHGASPDFGSMNQGSLEEDERRMMSITPGVMDRGMLMEESPGFDYSQSPPQLGSPDERRMMSITPGVMDQRMLMEESPGFDYSQSPPQLGSPELFRSPGTCGGMLFDQQMDAPQFDSPRAYGSPIDQDRFGLPDVIQLPPPREINFAPVRPPVPLSARTQRRQPSPPPSPDMQDYQPMIPFLETSFESPPYARDLKFSQCRGAMIEPIEDVQLNLMGSPEASPDRWQQMVAATPGENYQGMFMDTSPGLLQPSPGSPFGSASPDRRVSHSASKTRCITARRLDF